MVITVAGSEYPHGEPILRMIGVDGQHAYQAAEILVSDRKFFQFEGALPLANIRNVACRSFYEVENFWDTSVVRYFSSLLREV